MPTKKTWLLRLTQIREELTAIDVPVIDRALFERLFGVRRRRAIQLMHYFGGYQAGRTFLIDRLALLRQLEPLEASAEFALEQRRRQRLVETLEELRRSRTGAQVTIRVDPPRNRAQLPDYVYLHRGTLWMEFDDVQDLLAKLYQLSQAAAADFEAFRAAAEGTPDHSSTPVASRSAARAG
jgi:hypothetical protein